MIIRVNVKNEKLIAALKNKLRCSATAPVVQPTQEQTKQLETLQQEFNNTQSQLRKKQDESHKLHSRITELEKLLSQEKRSMSGLHIPTVSAVTRLMEHSTYMIELTRELCQHELGEEMGNLLCTSDVPMLVQFMIKIINHRDELAPSAVVCACNVLVLMFTCVAPDECINCLLNPKETEVVSHRIKKRWAKSRIAPMNSRINVRPKKKKERRSSRQRQREEPALTPREAQMAGKKFLERLFQLLESVPQLKNAKKEEIQQIQKQIVRLVLILLQHDAKTELIEKLCWNKGLIIDLLSTTDDTETKSHIVAILVELFSRSSDLSQKEELYTIQDEGMSPVDMIYRNLFDQTQSLKFRHGVLNVIAVLAQQFPRHLLYRTQPAGDKLPVRTIGPKNHYVLVPRLAQMLDSLNWKKEEDISFGKDVMIVVGILYEYCQKKEPEIIKANYTTFVACERVPTLDDEIPIVNPIEAKCLMGYYKKNRKSKKDALQRT